MEAAQGLDAWERGGARFDAGGHSLFWRQAGDGPPLLLIHGFPTASWDWHRVWPALAARFRVIAMDMLGFGFSAKPRGHDYSIFEQADLHEVLLAGLGIQRVHILAHDYGDTVAQELLARHAERRRSPEFSRPHPIGATRVEVASVCFLNGGLFPEAHHARPIQKVLAGPAGALASRFLTEQRFVTEFAAIFGPLTRPDAAALAGYWRLVARDGGARITHRLMGYLGERRRFRERWAGVLARATVPMRLVYGAEDPVAGADIAARYRELVSAADIVPLPGIGHYPQVEDPEGVLRAFLAFQDQRVGPAPVGGASQSGLAG